MKTYWFNYKSANICLFILINNLNIPFVNGNGEAGCNIPQTPFNGNYEVSGCSGVLVDPFDPPCWKDPNTKFPVGRSVTYFCLDGYILSGQKALTCMENGQWSGDFPRCCKQRSRLPGSNKIPLGISYATLNVFEEVGDKRSQLAGSDFNDPNSDNLSCPVLEKIKSVDFECRLPDGKINHCDTLPLPQKTVAHLKCAKYFKSSGDLHYRYRKCKPDGSWSTEGSITCITDCGKSDVPRKALITSGENSDRGQWPWHTALYLKDERKFNGKETYICGGTLISQHVVLTAAHCVTIPGTSEVRDKSTLTLILGKHFRDRDAKEVGPIQLRYPKFIYIPDGYNPFRFDADIAIIVLSSPAEFNFFVRPACIPESYNSLIEEYQIQEGNLGTVVGWGLTETGQASETLKMAQLPVISSRTCIDSYQQFFEQNKRYTNYCAGYQNGTGVCNGDSGGGMVFPSGEGDNLRWYLQGIVSVGVPDPDNPNKCDSHKYSLFTRVGRFSDWLVRLLTPDGYM